MFRMRLVLTGVVLAGAAIVSCALITTHTAWASEPIAVTYPGRQGVMLKGFVYEPKGPGPFPAVIALHGCSGLTDKDGLPSERHADWGNRLAAEGFLVLFPDSYASRDLGPQCRVSDRDVSPNKDRTLDVNASVAYLDTLTDVKPGAINLLGWSNGGSTVLYSVEPAHKPTTGQRDLAKAIAFYPGCRVPFDGGKWSSRLPLLILIGEADDWTAAAPCKEMVAAAKAAGEPVDIVTYPGAYHDFDHPNLPLHTQNNLAFTASGTGVAHTGTDPAARADAINRVEAFLAR
jgi:dienelactone hydrolase